MWKVKLKDCLRAGKWTQAGSVACVMPRVSLASLAQRSVEAGIRSCPSKRHRMRYSLHTANRQRAASAELDQAGEKLRIRRKQQRRSLAVES
ncbi:hypothetical protein HN011_005524 [Eciton burchellii]|nr:hypothetical protein HN011_005524 [Eciton burchellii]